MNRLDELRELRRRIDLEIAALERATGPVGIFPAEHRRVALAVAQHFHIDPALLLSDDRHKVVMAARHVLTWLLRAPGRSSTEVGQILDLHHTTVLHACKRVEGTPHLLKAAMAIRSSLSGTPSVTAQKEASDAA